MKLQLATSKLALVYPRQSSERQVDENIYSLENQLQLKQRAIADGFPAENVLILDDDLGVSGRTIAGRVGMSRALAMIDQGLVGALYAEDQTRLSRDKDTVDHMTIAKKCRAAGVPLFYAGGWRDLGDWGTRVAYKVEAVIGSEMWGLHMEKLHKAQKAKAMKGQAASDLPRGYRPNRDVPKKHPDRDRPVIFEPEAEVIRALVAKLPAAGSIRALFREVSPLYWPDGTPLSYTMLRLLLTNPIMRGHYRWGDVLVPESHEAIITPEQAAMIDQLCELNRHTRRKEPKAGTICAGLVWCPACERKINTARGTDAAKYVCQFRDGTETRNPVIHFGIQSEPVDRFVREDLFGRLANGLIDRIIEQLEGLEVARAATADTSEASRRVLQRKIEGFTRALGNPDLGDEAMRIVIQEMNAATEALKALDVVARSRGGGVLDLAFYRNLRANRELAANLPLLWEDSPIQWRRAWIRRFVERVEILNHRVGEHTIIVRYLDGSSATSTYRGHVPIGAEEEAIVRELVASPAFPRRGFLRWLQRELAARGHQRGTAAVARLLRRIRERSEDQGHPD